MALALAGPPPPPRSPPPERTPPHTHTHQHTRLQFEASKWKLLFCGALLTAGMPPSTRAEEDDAKEREMEQGRRDVDGVDKREACNRRTASWISNPCAFRPTFFTLRSRSFKKLQKRN